MVSQLALIAVASAAEVSGQVMDARGTPVTSATVYAFDRRLGSDTTTTDGDGRFSFTALPAGGYRLWAAPAADQNLSARLHPAARLFCDADPVVLDAEDHRDDVDITLADGARLKGQLRDIDGEPVAEAVATVASVDGEDGRLARAAITDSDGIFEVVGLDVTAEDTDGWTCAVEAPDFPKQFLGGVYEEEAAEVFAVEPADSTDAGVHSLRNGIVVEGGVFGPDGTVADADVHVYSGGQVLSVVSEDDGLYTAMGLPPGDVLSWASAPGLATTYFPDADRPGDRVSAPDEDSWVDGVDLTLPPESIFRIQLVGAAPETDGDLSGASVLLYNDTHTVGRGEPVAADGTVAVDALHGGTYELYVYAAAEGHTDDWVRDPTGARQSFDIAEQTEHSEEITLVDAAIITGQIVDDEGAPVYGARVIASPVVLMAPRDDAAEVRTSTADSEGRYTLTGLATGTWAIEARYDAYCESDPGYVAVVWPGEVNPEWWEEMALSERERNTDVDFALPRDDDHDEMGDGWEVVWGLDIHRDDAAEDPDDDGFTNLDEYRLGTNPVEAFGTVESCGCKGSKAAAWLWLPLWFGRRSRPLDRGTGKSRPTPRT